VSVVLEVKVQPRSSRDAILGVTGGVLRIALVAPPVDGAANDALVAFLAERLGVPKRAIEIVRGETARRKTVRIEGVTDAAVAALSRSTSRG